MALFLMGNVAINGFVRYQQLGKKKVFYKVSWSQGGITSGNPTRVLVGCRQVSTEQSRAVPSQGVPRGAGPHSPAQEQAFAPRAREPEGGKGETREPGSPVGLCTPVFQCS